MRSLRNISLTLLFFVHFSVFANGNCHGVSGPNPVSINVGSLQISDPQKNTAGYTVDPAYSWNGFSTTMTCDCTESSAVWVFTAQMYLPESDTNDNWYSLNNYLDTQVRIIDKYWTTPKTIPFSNQITSGKYLSCKSTPTTQPAATGTVGNLALRIRKPFVGTAFINNTKVASVFTCMATDEVCIPDGQPTMDYYFSGTVTVPQNCVINAGTELVVNLGDFYSNDFNTIGEKPESYTPKTFNVPIQCNDATASANLTLRLQGTVSTGVINALASDNPDVAVVVTDGSGNLLIPNNSSSVIPLTLDDNNQANITLRAYPVGTTGKTPTEGVFTTLAYLRVDFS